MNKIPIFSLTLLFILISPLFANAQVTVKGIVTDESGVPLVGVSVRYKEVPQVGVTTDIDGKFSIKEVEEGKTLVFSYIGMKNAERLLKGTTSFIKIQMEAETSELSSRPREFHPQPLSEPYVKVSLHTALRIQIISFDVHRVHILLANDKTDWVLSELYRLTNNEQI